MSIPVDRVSPTWILTAIANGFRATKWLLVLVLWMILHCCVLFVSAEQQQPNQAECDQRCDNPTIDTAATTNDRVPNQSTPTVPHHQRLPHHHQHPKASSFNTMASKQFEQLSHSVESAIQVSTTSRAIFRQALISTALVIGGTFLLVHLFNMFRRRKSGMNRGSRHDTASASAAGSGGKLRHGYNVIGTGINFDQQSIQYKDNPVERMSRLCETDRQLRSYEFENVKTMYDVFPRGRQETEDGRCLGRVNRLANTVEWISYADVLTRTKQFADGLLQIGLKADNRSCLGIYAANCPEYVIAEHGSYRHSIVVVPIYDTLGTNVASFIANQAELTCITCDKVERIDRIIEQEAMFKTLKHIVLMNDAAMSEELRQRVISKGFQLHSMAEVEKLGAQHPQTDHKPGLHDLAIICYTSGTTSDPKGVMLTHENVVASVSTISIHLMDQHATKDDIMISILPLAHMFQRIAEASVFCEGGKVTYYSGDIQQLAAEIQIARPTIMLAVPRLLNRIYDAIYSKVRGNLIKKTLLRLAYQSKRRDLARHVIRTDTIWDWLVFSRIRANLGGRVRLICVGSAPLSHNVLDFLRCALGCVISEGYGQTECVGPCTATLMGDATTGHIGPPLVGSLVKLADFADMNYFAKDGKGEILVKGPVVFQGYYKMPEKTAETLDSDGWLHTGDIGMWTDEGTLRLIDRKKNIFKLSQGEYIAPEKIENVLINSRYVTQIFVYGESLKSVLVAIIVPDVQFIASLPNPKLRGLDLTDKNSLNKAQLKDAIIEDLQRIGKRAGLKSFELPKSLYIHPDPFTIEQGLLTPTLKSKRNEIAKQFREEIDALYSELDSAKE